MTLIIEKGDCLKLMKELPDASIDLFICDLPYVDVKGKGETNCKWNQSVIDMDKFWEQFRRLRKSTRTACIHFCSTKFGYTLIKSWEKGYKMDMVWKKRNKTGGLQSRNRPMRNHEMVYFFYDQAPKYNRDKYHKRIAAEPEHKTKNYETKSNEIHERTKAYMSGNKNLYDPRLPASVIEQKKNKTIKGKDRKAMGEQSGIYTKENMICSSFEPPNPASVVEETIYGIDKDKAQKSGRKDFKGIGTQNAFDPPNPASVVDTRVNEKGKSPHGWDIEHMDKPRVAHFKPKLPVSVLEEKDGMIKYDSKVNGHKYGKKEHGAIYTPPNPASVVEEKIGGDIYGEDKESQLKRRKEAYLKSGNVNTFDPPNPASVMEDEPVSMFESTKVFIGKRHHQTEKPQDILEFFLKYWTDEGDTVLDPTMGSGSTGVACKKLDRNFIGFEKDDNIFKVAESRLK